MKRAAPTEPGCRPERVRYTAYPGGDSDEFSEISYSGQNGAPSFASILDLPRSGCWRLSLTTGELHASVDIEAVPD